MPSEKIKVMICDDHSLFRNGVRGSLQGRDDIDIIGEAENGQDLLQQLEHRKPDIVILNINMPVMDGFTALPILRRKYPALKVIILTMHNDPSVVRRMIELGANSYLTKEAGSQEIYEAIMGCYRQWFYLTEVIRRAMAEPISQEETQAKRLGFTPKEFQILNFLSQQKTLGSIADTMNLSPRTVEALIDKMKKLVGANTIEELVMFSIKKDVTSEN